MPLIGLVVAAAGIAGDGYVFLKVQVLQSYPFYNGVYGNVHMFDGVTYTEGLELFGAMAAAGLFVRAYASSSGSVRDRTVWAFGSASLVLGAIVCVVIYAETNLAWGEILPGVRVWKGLPGGGGYPWGSERVTYNTCFIGASSGDNCLFLNYDGLFLLAFLAFIAGFIIRSYGEPS